MSVLSMLKTVSAFAGLSGRPGQDRDDRAAGLFARQANAALDKLSGSGIALDKETVKEIKDSVEISQSLQRMAESMKDGARSNRVSEIKQKIAELKQRLQFATPKQAKALLKELKQLAQDFKGAAAQLGSDASALSSGGTGVSGVQAMAGAEAQAGEGDANADTGGETATPFAVASPDTATGLKGGSAGNETGAGADAGPGEEAAPGEGTGSTQEEFRSALQAYIGEQEAEEQAVARSRAERMKDERETLKEIGEDLKQLAEKIEKLARRDRSGEADKRSDAQVSDRAIDEGLRALNGPGLMQALSRTPAEPAGASARSGPAPASSVAPGQAHLAYSASAPTQVAGPGTVQPVAALVV